MSNIDEDSLLSKVDTYFEHGLIKEVLKSKFANPKNKITDDAIELVSEITRVLVVEVTARAMQEANSEHKKKINLDHIETVLPQIMLDFP